MYGEPYPVVCMVSPVLSYGSEVWAPHMMLQKTNPCDKMHLGFLRRLMNVRQSTSSLIVYAETGQLPFISAVGCQAG